jgi:hypothetical protein
MLFKKRKVLFCSHEPCLPLTLFHKYIHNFSISNSWFFFFKSYIIYYFLFRSFQFNYSPWFALKSAFSSYYKKKTKRVVLLIFQFRIDQRASFLFYFYLFFHFLVTNSSISQSISFLFKLTLMRGTNGFVWARKRKCGCEREQRNTVCK